VGAFSDAALSLGEAAPVPEAGASEGDASDLKVAAGALAGVALGVAAAFSGDVVGAFSDLSGDVLGAFDGVEAECFGEVAGASAANATAAEATTRRKMEKAIARAMVRACLCSLDRLFLAGVQCHDMKASVRRESYIGDHEGERAGRREERGGVSGYVWGSLCASCRAACMGSSHLHAMLWRWPVGGAHHAETRGGNGRVFLACLFVTVGSALFQILWLYADMFASLTRLDHSASVASSLCFCLYFLGEMQIPSKLSRMSKCYM
jgi:hypothetical protein